MKKKVLNTIWVVVFFINTLTALAKPLPPAPSGFPFDPSGTDDEPAGASIDQALIWLIVAGIIWSFLFFKNTLKKQTVSK